MIRYVSSTSSGLEISLHNRIKNKNIVLFDRCVVRRLALLISCFWNEPYTLTCGYWEVAY